MSAEKNDRLDIVTYLKGIAIIMVISCHVVAVLPLPPILSAAGSLGIVGCQMFFMLSAFTLCLSYSRRAPSYGAFMKRRFDRIVPHYWGVLLIYILLVLAGAVLTSDYSRARLSIVDILCNFFLIHGLVPDVINRFVLGGWFVGTIMLFYLLFPFLYKGWNAIGQKIPGRAVKTALIICLQLLSVAIVELSGARGGYISFVYYYLPNQLPCILTGFLLFDMYTDGSLDGLWHPLLRFILLFAGGSAIGLFQGRFSYDTTPLIFGFSFVFLFAFLHSRKTDVSKNAARRVVIGFGKESFGIYLIHMLIVFYLIPPIYQALREAFGGGLLLALLFTAAIFIISYWTGRIYNRLIEGLKEKMRPKMHSAFAR